MGRKTNILEPYTRRHEHNFEMKTSSEKMTLFKQKHQIMP